LGEADPKEKSSFLLGGTAIAEKRPPASVQIEIEKLYPSYSVESFHLDDLNNDGITDYAAVICKADENMIAEVVVFWVSAVNPTSVPVKATKRNYSRKLSIIELIAFPPRCQSMFPFYTNSQ
jgi:hypothetical protein